MESLKQGPSLRASDRTDAIRIERVLPGPRERVWRYLTEPDLRRRWLAAGAFDLVPGGAVELVFRNNELTPERRCSAACRAPGVSSQRHHPGLQGTVAARLHLGNRTRCIPRAVRTCRGGRPGPPHGDAQPRGEAPHDDQRFRGLARPSGSARGRTGRARAGWLLAQIRGAEAPLRTAPARRLNKTESDGGSRLGGAHHQGAKCDPPALDNSGRRFSSPSRI